MNNDFFCQTFVTFLSFLHFRISALSVKFFFTIYSQAHAYIHTHCHMHTPTHPHTHMNSYTLTFLSSLSHLHTKRLTPLPIKSTCTGTLTINIYKKRLSHIHTYFEWEHQPKLSAGSHSYTSPSQALP